MRRRVDAAVRLWQRLGLISIAIVTLGLSGCARYELGIQFDHANHGVLVQHLRLAESFANLSGQTTDQWLATLEHQAHQVQGKVKHLGPRDLQISIPFNNGADLEAKFNQFFQFQLQSTELTDSESPGGLPEIQPHLHLTQNNFLFVLRNILTYDLDLTKLGIRSEQGEVLVSPGSLVTLEFELSTPWGVKVVDTGSPYVPVPQNQPDEKRLVWSLQPGQNNHLEVIFWLPSPIGFGTLGIVTLIAIGFYLKPEPAQPQT